MYLLLLTIRVFRRVMGKRMHGDSLEVQCAYMYCTLLCHTLAFIGDPAFIAQNTIHTPGVD